MRRDGSRLCGDCAPAPALAPGGRASCSEDLDLWDVCSVLGDVAAVATPRSAIDAQGLPGDTRRQLNAIPAVASADALTGQSPSSHVASG